MSFSILAMNISILLDVTQCNPLNDVRRLLTTANVNPSSPILVTLMTEALRSFETPVLVNATYAGRQHSS
jgi:hypothetical protein